MEKSSFKWWQILCMGLLYLVFVFASCFIGFLHPVCWAYFSVLAALLAAGPYFWLAARWQKFGVGTFCAALVCIFCLPTGEAGGLLSKAIILGGGLLADIVSSPTSSVSLRATAPERPSSALIRCWPLEISAGSSACGPTNSSTMTEPSRKWARLMPKESRLCRRPVTWLPSSS